MRDVAAFHLRLMTEEVVYPEAAVRNIDHRLAARTARRGVAADSSGNHGAALARAAKLRGIPAYVVMPSNSAKVKIRAVKSYGAEIMF